MLQSWRELYWNRRMAAMTLLGFSSGLPLALSGSTLQAWMVSAGVDLATVGVFALVGLPYTLKFVWAPLMDRYSPARWFPERVGRRRAWILLCQCLLMIALVAMAGLDPVVGPARLAGVALAVAFLSASQDLVIDALRAESLDPPEVAAGAAVTLGGYRVAMIVSGAVALILSDHLHWQQVYLVMAATLVLGVVGVILSVGVEPRAAASPRPVAPLSLRSALLDPFRAFFARRAAFEMLVFVVLYKLDSVVSQAMKTPFFLELGFSKTDIGVVSKGFGMVAVVGGALVGGGLVARLGLRSSLIAFGVLQAASNLVYLILAQLGPSHVGLISVIAIDEICGGMGNVAFVGFLTQLCSRRFTATQYALLSSLAAVSRVVLAAPSGALALQLGWTGYYWMSAATAIPGLLLLTLRFSQWETQAHE